MQKRLTLFIDGREALPVRAISYVAGRRFLSPDEVAKHLARQVGAPFARLRNTTAFHLSEQSPISVLPKEWDEIVTRFDALESKLKRVQPNENEGYEEWQGQSTPLLPSGVFVWCDEFEKDFRLDIERIAPEYRREGDDILNYSPMLSDEQRKMILEGAPLIGRMDGKVCNMEKPNWREWPYMPTVMIWQAVALSMNLDPYAMALDRRFPGDHNHQAVFLQNGNFASRDDKDEFELRLKILMANRDDRTHFSQRRPDRLRTPGPFSEVALSEFTHWASSVVKWDNLPAELLAVIQTPEMSADAPAQTNDSEHEVAPGYSDPDTGIEERAFEAAFNEPSSISWRYWVHQMPTLTAAQAARLISGLEPDEFQNLDNGPTKNDHVSQLCEKAKKIQRLAETEGKLSATPGEWLEWADGHGFKVHYLFRFEVEAISCDAPTVGEASNTSLAVNGARQAGMGRKDILMVDWPLSGTFNQESLDAALSDVPKWLEQARVAKGAPGKGSALWNPAMIADCLAQKGYANRKALTTLIRNSFSEWLNEWEQMQEYP
jgi:hypothetical protein